MREFVSKHRAEIDAAINARRYRYDGSGGRGKVPDPPPRYTDAERREWVMNEEELYKWARLEVRGL